MQLIEPAGPSAITLNDRNVMMVPSASKYLLYICWLAGLLCGLQPPRHLGALFLHDRHTDRQTDRQVCIYFGAISRVRFWKKNSQPAGREREREREREGHPVCLSVRLLSSQLGV